MSSLCLPATYLGCGAGVGALATSLLQGIPLRATREVGSKAGRPGADAAAVQDAKTLAGCPSSCADSEFLNGMVEILWPHINKHLKALVEERVLPAIDEALPSEFRGSIKVDKLSIGDSTPRFGGIDIRRRSDQAIVMDLSVDLTSDLDVQIKALQIPLGIRAFSFHGTLTVVLWPPASKPPFFGGFQIYFVNPPAIHIDFQGAAQLANLKMLYSVIHDTIMKTIMNSIVIPARIAHDLVEDDDVGMNELRCPEPIGVLRLLVRSARNLPGDDLNFDNTRTSDPYVVVELGQHRWRSKTVHRTTSPKWEHGNVADYLVYDEQQRINFKVYDEDDYSQDDLLGHALGVSVAKLMRGVSEESLALVAPGTSSINSGTSPQVSSGFLTISTRWFRLTDDAPVKGISPGVAKGPSQLVLRAQIEEVRGCFPAHAPAPFFVRLRVVGVGEDFSATSSASKAPKSKKVSDDVRRICLDLVQRRTPLDAVASITGLTNEQVDTIVRLDSHPDEARALGKRDASTNPTFNQTLRLLLPWTAEMLTKAAVSLEVLDGKRRLVGSCVLQDKGVPTEAPLQSIALQGLSGEFPISRLSPLVSLQSSLSIRWLQG